VILSVCTLFAQTEVNTTDSLESQRDANGILSSFFSGNSKPINPVNMSKVGSWSVLPSAAYNPSVGFAIGAISSGGKYFGDPVNTTLSVINAGAYISTNKLSTFEFKHNAFSSQNQWNLQGS
jgi:hypothetical protein